MILFATEFPVTAKTTTEDFASAFRLWLVGSPHTQLTAEDLADLSEPEWATEKVAEKLELRRFDSSTVSAAAFRYTKDDGQFQWVTTIGFSHQRGAGWIGLRTLCESTHPSTLLPRIKKPVLVRTLLDRLGGGMDGGLVVGSEPHRLTDQEVNVAAQCMSGASGCRLPIVYVSAPFSGAPAVDANSLARALSGMAHVLVEPDRSFSWNLRHETDSDNVYGGTIGIYWPEGAGRRSFFRGPALPTSADIHAAVLNEVQTALTNRRPLHRCTWPAVAELVSKRAIEHLREKGSTDLDEYIELFDNERRAREAALQEAEREIGRLTAEVRHLEARSSGRTGISLQSAEQDLYEGEVLGVVRDTLADGMNRVPADSRRRHILESIVAELPAVGAAGEMRDELKSLLRGYRSMDARIRRGLQELGFELSEDGKHHKLTLRGDERYTFILPKSGGDRRGGLNAASDISRLFF